MARRTAAQIGGGDKCKVCGKNVYPIEKVTADNAIFHSNCFKCEKPQCNQRLRVGNYTVFAGSFYCKPHGAEMSKLQGNFAGKPTINTTPATPTAASKAAASAATSAAAKPSSTVPAKPALTPSKPAGTATATATATSPTPARTLTPSTVKPASSPNTSPTPATSPAPARTNTQIGTATVTPARSSTITAPAKTAQTTTPPSATLLYNRGSVSRTNTPSSPVTPATLTTKTPTPTIKPPASGTTSTTPPPVSPKLSQASPAATAAPAATATPAAITLATPAATSTASTQTPSPSTTAPSSTRTSTVTSRPSTSATPTSTAQRTGQATTPARGSSAVPRVGVPAATTTSAQQAAIPAWQLRAQQAKASRLGTNNAATTTTSTTSTPEEVPRPAGSRPGFGGGVRPRSTLYSSADELKKLQGEVDQALQTPKSGRTPTQDIPKPAMAPIQETPKPVSPKEVTPKQTEQKKEEPKKEPVVPKKEEPPKPAAVSAKPLPLVNDITTEEITETLKAPISVKQLASLPTEQPTTKPLTKTLPLPANNAAVMSVASPRGLTRLTSPRVVPKPRGHTRQRSRADNMGVKSTISVAMARAGTALSDAPSTIPEGNVVESSPDSLLAEIAALNERIETLEVVNADALRTIETISQQKSTLEQNNERIKDDLRNQYKENAQIQPLIKERDDYKEKLEKMRQDATINTSSLSTKLKDLQNTRDQIDLDLKNERESKSRLQSERDELLERVKVIDDLRNVRDQLQRQNADSERVVQKLKKELEDVKTSLEKASEFEEKYKTLMRTMKPNQSQQDSNAEYSRIKANTDQLEKELKKTKEDNRTFEATITRLQSENAQLTQSVVTTRQNLSVANEMKVEALNNAAKFEQEIDDVKAQRDKLSFELKQAQSNLKLVTSESDRIAQQFRAEMQHLVDERTQLDAALQASEEELKSKSIAIERLDLEKQTIKQEKAELQSTLQNKHDASVMVENLKAEHAAADKDLKAAKAALKTKDENIEKLNSTITKLESDLFELECERDELKHDIDAKDAVIEELKSSASLTEDYKSKIEQTFEQKLAQLEQRNKKLQQAVTQKTQVAEAAEAIITGLKESLANAQHQHEYLIEERDYLQTENDKIKKDMTSAIADLDGRASREVISLSEQLELLTADRDKLITKCDTLQSQTKELQEERKSLNYTINDLRTEVASLKDVNADLHGNLEKLEEQREQDSKELKVVRETNKDKLKKVADDLDKAIAEKTKAEENAMKFKAEIASLTTTTKRMTEAAAEAETTIAKLKQQVVKMVEEREEIQATFGDTDQVIASISKERDRLQVELTRLSTGIRDLDKIKEENQRAQHQIQRQTTELEDLNREREHIQRRLDRFTRENKDLTDEVSSLKQQHERVRGIELELRNLRSEKSDLETECIELSSVRDELHALKRTHASLVKENEDLLRQNEEKKSKLGDFDKVKVDYETLKVTNTLQEGELRKLEEELGEYKELVKAQEEDLDKFEEEILRLRDEVHLLTLKNKELEQGVVVDSNYGGDETGGDDTAGNLAKTLRQKQLELRILTEKNNSLEKAAATLAMQVTQLCDAMEKSRELETAFAKLDSENERLANEVKILEAELNARETEIENVLSDNQQLVLKLNSLGLKVKLTDEGITFIDN